MILTTPLSVFYRLTPYSLIFSILLYTYPSLFTSNIIIDTIKGLSFLIATSVIYIYSVYGDKQIHKLYGYFIGNQFPIITYYLLDFVIHFLPVMLLGLPSHINGIFYAYFIIVIWYLSIRHFIQKLYFETMNVKEYDFIIFVYLISVSLLYTIII